MAGAQPTLTGITDDASRGGLFDRSNVASPVSGADVTGTVINDSTITLSISIDGNTETGTFTTNQAADSTVSFDFTGIGGGGTGGGADGVVDGGSFDANTGTLTLMRSNGLTPITVTGFSFSQRTDADINRLADARIAAADIGNLNDVANTRGTAGQVLSVASDGMSLEYVDPATASVSSSSFSSNDSTIAIGQNGAQVNLEARPEWTGNTNNGDNVGAAGVQAQNIILAADTGLILDNNGGQVTIRMADAAPAPAQAPQTTAPPPSSAIGPSPRQVVTFRGAGTDTVTMVNMVTVNDPSGSPITTGVSSTVSGGVGMIVIDAGETNAPGNYMISSEVTTMSTDGETRTTTESETINRFIPFFQSRTRPMSESDITGGTASDAAWTGSLTAIPGTGILYISVLQSLLPDDTMSAMLGLIRPRVVRLGTAPISVRTADGVSQMYNVFQVSANGGVMLSDFRNTRF